MAEVNGKSAAIRCEGVGLTIKKKRLLDNVTFEADAGTMVGLLGPNGAGKSTLMRVLLGLMMPDAGEVSLFGRVPGEATMPLVSFLPDRGQLPAWLTADEWLSYAAQLYPDWDDGRLPALSELLGVNGTTAIGSLSRGEEARLQLLTCLVRRAPLVVLDEPFAGVDLVSREKIASALVGAQADEQRTFLIATHDIREMESLFDRIVLFGGGTVKGVYDTERLREKGISVESCYREVFA